MSIAETDVKEFMKLIGVNFEHDKFTELIIYDEIQLKHIRKQYEHIGQKYMGHVKGIIHEMENLKSEIRYLNEKHEKEIAHKNTELTQKDVELANKNTEIANKDKEISDVKHTKEIDHFKYQSEIDKLRKTVERQNKLIKKLQSKI